MKTVLGTWLVAMAVAVSMVGCATPVDEGNESIVPRGMPREMPGEEPIEEPGEEPIDEPSTSATLIVQNDSSETIFYLYVSRSIDPDWGPDQLGSSTVIDPGESFRLEGIPCGIDYDLMATDAYDQPLATTFGNRFACGDTLTWRLY